MEDYKKSYQTTGKPPQPCPITPTGRADRERAGYPPLFTPYVEIGGNAASLEQCIGTAVMLAALGNPAPKDPTQLPDVQVFQPTPDTSESGARVWHQNIVSQHLYSAFSPEVRDCV